MATQSLPGDNVFRERVLSDLPEVVTAPDLQGQQFDENGYPIGDSNE